MRGSRAVRFAVSAAFGGILLAGHILSLGQADPGTIAKGKQIYAEKKCAACHMINRVGGKTGGDLSDVGAKRDVQWLKAFLKDPKAANPKSKMMAFRGTDDELEALAAYMASLK